MTAADSLSKGKTLLIVEDEILPAMSLRDELTQAGYDVMDLVDNCEAALAATRELAPDLALVNIRLHGQDDGIELARRLKAMGVPVLFISGQVTRARSEKSVAIGSLPKPYRASDMVKAVDYLLLHLAGDELPPLPPGLEVFADSGEDLATEKPAA